MPDVESPSSHAPLSALPVLVLDLETTGLDVARDRVVQIGAIGMEGTEIGVAPRIDRLVRPPILIPPASTRIHGITDADVADAGSFTDATAELYAAIAGRVVVGHHVAFDLAVLRAEAHRAGIEWSDPVALDVARLVGALEPGLVEVSLDAVADWLGIASNARHTAIGDALTTAQAFAALIPKMRERGVRTLGEALTLASRRDDLLRREIEAGWHGGTAEAWTLAGPGAARIDVDVYVNRIDSVMQAPPIAVPLDTTIRTAARAMTERRIGAILVGDARAPVGIVTERDLLRVVVDDANDLDAVPVHSVMSSPLETIEGDEMIYRALGRMDRLGIRHLPVTDALGNLVGMVSQRDVLRYRARAALVLGDAIEHADTGPDLARAWSRLPDVAAGLLADGLGGVEAARVVSTELAALTARATTLTAARLESQGLGEAPAPWCVFVLGSGGRGESLLSADQDNGLIHAGSEADDGWFAALGEGVADLLHEAGVARCTGGVMASSPGWRRTERDWLGSVDGWLHRARPDDLLNVDIFFDLVPVAGDADLGYALHERAVSAAARSPAFLGLLAQSVQSMPPRLGLFGRLRVENGRVDLKRDGLLSLVGLARALALKVGSPARATPARLRDAAAAGRISPADANRLVGIHARLLSLVAHQQIADLTAGIRPSSRVALDALDRTQRSDLKDAIGRLSELVDDLGASISG